MRTRKILSVIAYCCALAAVVAVLLTSCGKSTDLEGQYDWNGGHCVYDNTRLTYTGTGVKNHYTCKTCGREYTFDEIYAYED